MGSESQDLRYFKMNTLRRKDLTGTRKVGRCIRSLYCMSDDCPFKHSVEGKLNTTNFQNVGGHKVCFSCGNVATWPENGAVHIKGLNIAGSLRASQYIT